LFHASPLAGIQRHRGGIRQNRQTRLCSAVDLAGCWVIRVRMRSRSQAERLLQTSEWRQPQGVRLAWAWLAILRLIRENSPFTELFRVGRVPTAMLASRISFTARPATYTISSYPAGLAEVSCDAFKKNPDGSWTQVAILIAGALHRCESRLVYDRDKPRDLVVVGIALRRRDGLSFWPPQLAASLSASSSSPPDQKKSPITQRGARGTKGIGGWGAWRRLPFRQTIRLTISRSHLS
jgi:hypothetical protein